jgi:energy-converting hydrogenase A subunit N
MKSLFRIRRSPSIFVFPLHMGGSNATSLELAAIFTPPYNAARYGISLTTSPLQADVVLLVGSFTPKMAGPVLDLLASLPDDVRLLQVGSDSTSAAPFARSYTAFGPLKPGAAAGEVEEEGKGFFLPPGKTITAYIAGAPPDPEVIIEAILDACR